MASLVLPLSAVSCILKLQRLNFLAVIQYGLPGYLCPLFLLRIGLHNMEGSRYRRFDF